MFRSASDPKSKRSTLLNVALGTLAFSLVASAAPIGDFGFTTTGVLVFQLSGPTRNFIDWCPTNTVQPGTVGTGCGVANTGTGTIVAQPGPGFGAIGPNENGTIRDTTDNLAASGPVPGFAFLPATLGPLAPADWIHNYINLPLHSNWDFTATQLKALTPAECTPIANQQDCIGAFKLNQTGNDTSVQINVLGFLFDSSNNTTANFRAIITGQYTNMTIAQVEAAAQTANGVFSNTTSGKVVTDAVPEPATMLFSGFGLIALSIAGRRYRRNR